MIKFFRRIRKSQIRENRMGKYFKYAIGEILLVVIGILIALQINNWNQKRIDNNKEEKFLLEIKENLNEDLQKIDATISANQSKLRIIDSAYYYLSLMNDNPNHGKRFSQFMPTVTNYSVFSPTRVAFDNIIATGKIGVLRSDDLRKIISRYYSDKSLNSNQNQITTITQNFLDNVGYNLINKTMMQDITKRDFDVISIEQIAIHKDPKVLSGLFVLLNKTKEQNYLLDKMKVSTSELITSINNYLDTK